MDEQEAVCLSRLAGGEQRERLGSQRSSTGDRGKPGRVETEVPSPGAVASFLLFSSLLIVQTELLT